MRDARTLLITGAILAAVGILGACTGPATQTGAPPAGEAGTESTSGSFAARTLDGKRVTVPGSKASVLFFFSVECGGCGPSAQALAEAQRDVGDQATFVAVDIAGYETAEDVQRFLTEFRATTLAYAIDTDTAWMRRFGVNQLSTAVIVDASGKEVFRAVEPTAAQVRSALAKVGP